MAEVQSIKLLEQVIIASCGAKSAGDVVTSDDCGESWNWILDHINYEVITGDDEEVVTPPVVVDATDSTEEVVTPDVQPDSVVVDAVESPVHVLTEDETATVEAVKSVLASGKSRLKDLLEKTGLTEEVVSPVLTEANGFYVNQQGWYGLVKS